MTDPTNLTADHVLSIVRERFPREFEIATQQAYIQNLEAALKGEEPDPKESTE
jgi:hypothetical protein